MEKMHAEDSGPPFVSNMMSSKGFFQGLSNIISLLKDSSVSLYRVSGLRISACPLLPKIP